jgi:hypothetical protein
MEDNLFTSPKVKGEDYVTQIIDYCMYRGIDVVGWL